MAYVDVLNNIGFAFVLAQRSDTDTMTSIAMKVLNQDVGAIRFEGDTIVTIVDVTVLNDDVVAAVGIPPICILCHVLAGAKAVDCDVGEQYVRAVRYEIVVLGRVA